MKFYKVRDALLQGKSISDLPLKVTFYARVSTDSSEQLNSLENQVLYFKNYIISNSNWTYVDGYIDEGISGSSVRKRKNFLRMLDDAKKGCFDLIITKEVSRFSRNLFDSIKYTQQLISNNVGVYFQTNGINTYDPNSEFILNMMGSVAQEEVKRLSTRVKWGQHNAIKRGRVLGSNNITGYKKENAKLVIIEDEAFVVRKIFELYASGHYGFYKLALKLHEMGIDNSKGEIYDKNTLKRIISNPKYKGYYCGHTTEVMDYRTKQRVSIPKNEQVIYKDSSIPAIVSEELWNRANSVLNLRSNIVKNKSISNRRSERKYVYSGKVFCKEHNTSYHRSTGSKRSNKPVWACGCYMKYRVTACRSPIIAEKDLDNILIIIFNKIFENKEQIFYEMYSYYDNLKIKNRYYYEIKKNKSAIEEIELKKEKILELVLENSLSSLEFKKKNNQYNNDILFLKSKIMELEKENDSITFQNLYLTNIKQELENDLMFKSLLRELADVFLDEIIVSKIDCDRNNIKLDIFLKWENFSEKVIQGSKYLNNFNESLALYSTFYETIDSGRSNFKKNKFLCNVYIR